MTLANNSQYRLAPSTLKDVQQLMCWFESENALLSWSGPNFRYPFTFDTFVQDLKLAELHSFTLLNQDQQIAAFGQFYPRLNRCHLGRLIVSPNMRGKGVAKILLEKLAAKGKITLKLNELSLFVLTENKPAIRAYEKFGFTFDQYPIEMPIPNCLYMTAC